MNKIITSFDHMYGGMVPKTATDPTAADRSVGMKGYPFPLARGSASALNVGPFGMLRRLAQAFILWNDVRATRETLSKLTDHELDDIGLTRHDIDTMYRKAVGSLWY